MPSYASKNAPKKRAAAIVRFHKPPGLHERVGCVTLEDMDSGSYNLGFEKRDGYLYARVQADFMDLNTAKKYLGEIADRVVSDGYKKLLLERDIPTMLGPGSLYFATQFFTKHIGESKVALVNVYQPIKDEMNFAVLIAKNHGGAFQVFESVEQAEAWLLRD